MTSTSANTEDLATFVSRSNRQRSAIEELRSAATTASNAVRAASADYHPDGTNLGSVSSLIETLLFTEQYANTVRQALVEADQFSAQPSVDDSVVLTALRQRGLLRRPPPVGVKDLSVLGIPPTSGFVDDPICAANGNFVHEDSDLAFPGFASLLDSVRVYNSLALGRPGAFGPGWSCLLDMRVSMMDDEAPVVSLHDGAALTFLPDEGSGFVFDQRRRLGLVRRDEGWELCGDDDQVWIFDDIGELVGARRAAAWADVERRADEVILSERLSGRWVAYRSANGRVVATTCSDGRECHYRYDSDGHLVAAIRPSGALEYVIEAGLIGSVVDADGVVLLENEYDHDGRVLRQTSPHGRTSTYGYDDLGVTRVSDTEDGPVNVLVHDRHGNLTSLIDGHGNDMRLGYDTEGRVVRLVDRLGHTTAFAYAESGLLTRRHDPDGLTHSWVWDDQGRLVSDSDRAGGTTAYEYAPAWRTPIRIVGPDGAVVETRLDDRGLPVEVIDPDGVVTRLGWTNDGLLASVQDALGNRQSFTYDERGLLVGARDPSGVAVDFALDTAGRVVQTATADGVRRSTYSPAGRLTETVETDGGVWRYRYGPSGEVERLTDPRGASLRLGRDSHGNVSTFVAPDGAVYRHEHDELGRLVAVVDPAGGVTRHEYDAEGRSVAVTDAGGRTWRREVDPLGRTVRITAPDGTAAQRSYHPNGELFEKTDAEGRTWQHTIDSLGRLAHSVDPAGGDQSYTYSAAGRPLVHTTAAGHTVRRSYDRAGRLVGVLDGGRASAYQLRPDGQIEAWREGGAEFRADYDQLGRLTSVDGPALNFSQRWAHGRVVEAGTGAAQARFEWDACGHLAAVTDQAGIPTRFSHDERGRLVGQFTGGTSTRAQFDEVGYLRRVFDSLGHHTDLSPDASGRTERVDLPDGRSLQYRHTPVGLPESISTGDGALLAQFAYDATGALVEATNGATTTRVEYDDLGQVRSISGRDSGLAYERNPDGVVVSIEDESGYAVVLQRSEAGEIEAFQLPTGEVVDAPRSDVMRDSDGRVTRDEQGRTYAYDAVGRLVKSVAIDGSATTYGYGTLGLLSSQRDERGEQRFHYNDAGQLVERIGPSTWVDYSYDLAGRRVSERRSDGSRVEYHWDALDRLVAINRVAPSGDAQVRSVVYDAFDCPVLVDDVPVAWDLADTRKPVRVGESRYLRSGLRVRSHRVSAEWQPPLPDDPWGEGGGTGVRLGYRGELALDGLVIMGARVYEPAARQFLTPDRAEPSSGALTYAGPYSYAFNDPVNFVDPTGLRPVSEAEYDDIRRRQERGVLKKAWSLARDDPWLAVAATGLDQVRRTSVSALGSLERVLGSTASSAAAHVVPPLIGFTQTMGRVDPGELARSGLAGLKEGTEWIGHQSESFAKGVLVDGGWETLKGLGSFFGLQTVPGDHFSWGTAKQSWLGLYKLAAATSPRLREYNRVNSLPGIKRGELDSVLTEAGKSFLAWDEWKDDPARALGATAFNVGSIFIPVKGGKIFTGRVGKAATTTSDTAKVVARLTEHPKIANAAELGRLRQLVGNPAFLERLLEDPKITSGAQLESMLRRVNDADLAAPNVHISPQSYSQLSKELGPASLRDINVYQNGERVFYTDDVGTVVVTGQGSMRRFMEVTRQVNAGTRLKFSGHEFEVLQDGTIAVTQVSPMKPIWGHGEAFNAANWHRYADNEVYLANGKRLDSYNPGEEIVERKFRQYSELKDVSQLRHDIDLIVDQYPPGTPIPRTPGNLKNFPDIAGDRLRGDMVLEIPPQRGPLSSAILDYADSVDVIVRDTTGKLYTSDFPDGKMP